MFETFSNAKRNQIKSEASLIGQKLKKKVLFLFQNKITWTLDCFSPQWFLGGPKLGKKYQKFEQISDTKYWGYVRNLVRFGAKKISLEMGGDECSHYARIIFFKKEMDQKRNFHPLLPIFSENQVSRWKSWLLFHWLYWVGSKKCKNLQESTKNYWN